MEANTDTSQKKKKERKQKPGKTVNNYTTYEVQKKTPWGVITAVLVVLLIVAGFVAVKYLDTTSTTVKLNKNEKLFDKVSGEMKDKDLAAMNIEASKELELAKLNKQKNCGPPRYKSSTPPTINNNYFTQEQSQTIESKNTNENSNPQPEKQVIIQPAPDKEQKLREKECDEPKQESQDNDREDPSTVHKNR